MTDLADYAQTPFADLKTEIGKLGSDFPNYADWAIRLPAGHWRAILADASPTDAPEGLTGDYNLLVSMLAEGMWAKSRQDLGLRADFMPTSRTDFIGAAEFSLKRYAEARRPTADADGLAGMSRGYIEKSIRVARQRAGQSGTAWGTFYGGPMRVLCDILDRILSAHLKGPDHA